MSDLPFSSTIRDFVFKINDEIEKVRKLQQKSGWTHEQEMWLSGWALQLQKLASQCSTVSSYEIDVRKHTGQKI